jgi:hypothetical protein
MSITFVDEKHGWIAGDADVLHTTDGGETWNVNRFKKGCEDYYALQDIHPTGISFSDQENGLLMFGSGLIAKSTDGGSSWCGVADLPTSATPDDCRTDSPESFATSFLRIQITESDLIVSASCLSRAMAVRRGGNWKTACSSTVFFSMTRKTRGSPPVMLN